MKRVLLLGLVGMWTLQSASCGGENASSNDSSGTANDAAASDAAQRNPATVQTIAQICANITSAGCGASECVDWAVNGYSESVDAGCGPKSEAYYACVLEHPMTCGSDGSALVDPACLALANEVLACFPSCGAEVLPDGVSCNFHCSGTISYAATCVPNAAGGGKTCTCTSGPAEGHTYDYTGPDCFSAEIDHLAWTNCGFPPE